MATRIKHVQGNVLRIQVPLTVKRVSVDNGSVVEVEEDFFPGTAYPASIIFKASIKRAFPASINGNVVSMQDPGTLAVGLYQIEVVCHDDGGNPFRYMVRDILEVVDATADAGIEAGVEIDSELYTLDGALFIGFAQEQSDWDEDDSTKVPYIKNKPTSLSQFAGDATHRTVTDAEKAAWSAKYDKPSGGIPATDLASGVIPDVSGFVTEADMSGALEDYTTTSAMETALSSKADVATTLAGYGITDAKIESGTITLGANTITPLTSHQDISGKADKDTDAVEGNFAAFDSSGNPVDSGHKHSDYITSHQDISGKADKVTGATNGNFAGLDANGNLTDSGSKASDFLTSHQDLSNYVQKSSTAGLLKNDGTVDTNTYLTQHQSVTDSDPTLAWNTRSKVGSVGSTDLHVTLPANPNPVPAATSSDEGKVLSVTDGQGTIAWTSPPPSGVTDVTLDGTSVVDGNGVAVLPAYPTTLPASDVYSWAKASTKPSYDYSEIANTPTLATVATSGSYTDLSNTPTIPTVESLTTSEIDTIWSNAS